MNRHTKLALFLAPLLLVGGYIASDQYLEYQANQPKIFQLSTQGECDIFAGNCILQSGEMLLSITDEAGVTKVNTSFPVDSVAISLVYNGGKEMIYELKKAGNSQYWERETDIRDAITEVSTAEKLRIVAKIKGNIYLSEFSSPVVSAN
mgnify:CR=1 FL=1